MFSKIFLLGVLTLGMVCCNGWKKETEDDAPSAPTSSTPAPKKVAFCEIKTADIHDFSIQCNHKIERIHYGTMTSSQKLSVTTKNLLLTLEIIKGSTLEGSVMGDESVVIVLDLDNGQVQTIDFKDGMISLI